MELKVEMVRDWYTKTYPDDELGFEMNPSVTFEEVYDVLRGQSKDVYDVLGVGDSLIRERVFTRLAEIRNVDYNDIYDMWLAY